MVGSKQASGEEDGGRDGEGDESHKPKRRAEETEINPSLDKVTIVGDVDNRVLIKKISKVGKIAEVMAPPPPPLSPAAPTEEGKKSDDNGSEKPTSPVDEKSARNDEGKDGKGDESPAAVAACNRECSKCTARKEAAACADEADRVGGKTASSKDNTVAASSRPPLAPVRRRIPRLPLAEG
uniref:HMA domain-containing protein n=1 Tax=Oryza meridionalis TaxID=40149 RepID=A0A0E0EV42_9ORYZ